MATGQDILDLGNMHIGEQYVFETKVPKNDKKCKGQWNSFEFASWLVFQKTGKLYGCFNATKNTAKEKVSTGNWNRDAGSIGIKISVPSAAGIPGAAIIRFAVSDNMGGHIVISDGLGGTVEAYSDKDGVIKGVVAGRRWDCGILIPWISYTSLGSIPVIPPDHIIYRCTSPMMVAPKIGEIQTALTNAGYSTNGIDNIFGKDTLNAVIAFQRNHELIADGEVGVLTAAVLGIIL